MSKQSLLRAENVNKSFGAVVAANNCLLYTSDAADE